MNAEDNRVMHESPNKADEDSSAHDTSESTAQEQLLEAVAEKEQRKLQARRQKNQGIWYGMGMFGMIGWSVAVPTLAFLALGIWIDRHFPSRFSWTIMLLVLGLGLGCVNAWFWVSREREQ